MERVHLLESDVKRAMVEVSRAANAYTHLMAKLWDDGARLLKVTDRSQREQGLSIIFEQLGRAASDLAEEIGQAPGLAAGVPEPGRVMKARIAAVVLLTVLYPRFAAILALVALCTVLAYELAFRVWEARTWRRVQADGLRQRCEVQHRQVLVGDPAAWWGLYPP